MLDRLSLGLIGADSALATEGRRDAAAEVLEDDVSELEALLCLALCWLGVALRWIAGWAFFVPSGN